MATSDQVQQFGDTINITLGSTVTAKTAVKLGVGIFGIPMEDGVSGDEITMAIRGSWELPKTGGGGVTFALGDRVYWNAGTSLATETTTDDLIGICIATAADADTVVKVELNGGVEGPITDAVLKTLFDAHTILYAVSDNTPVALTVGASRIVGRKAAGNIVALTAGEVETILGFTASDVALNTTHRTSNGSDHTFIDQDVTNGSAPVLAVTNMTGSAAGLDSDATAHAAADGSSHTFIDQDVTSGAAPVFAVTNMTGSAAGIDSSATAHAASDGSSHTFIDQDVTNGAAPVLAVTNMTGSAAGLDSSATAHAASDGSSHTFIDQDVTSGSSPTLDGANITGLPAASISGLTSVQLAEKALEDVQGAIPVLYHIRTPGGADSNESIAITNKSRVVNMWVNLKGAGTAGSDIKLRNVGSDITEAIDISAGADKDVFRAQELDDANQDVADGANLNVIWNSTGGDCPALDVYVLAYRVA